MKKIISLSTNNTVYRLDAVIDGKVVVDISYKMLGTSGLNRSATEEAHYLVDMVGQLDDKHVETILIPASRMCELTFIEVKVEKEDKSCETTTVEMQAA